MLKDNPELMAELEAKIKATVAVDADALLDTKPGDQDGVVEDETPE
jgi:hypothetical protein